MLYFTITSRKRKAISLPFLAFYGIIRKNGPRKGADGRALPAFAICREAELMPQDAFTLRYVARELDRMLAGGRINKIIQPSNDEVRLIVYTGKRTVPLVLNANASDCGAYFDGADAEAPLVAPNFCMLLRKYAQGAEIAGVGLVGFERILLFRLRGSTEFSTSERQLYLEVMGKYSNLILTENGVILGALKTTALDGTAKRLIFPGMPYTPPAPQALLRPPSPASSIRKRSPGSPASHAIPGCTMRVLLRTRIPRPRRKTVGFPVIPRAPTAYNRIG